MEKFMRELGCCIVGRKQQLSAREHVNENRDNLEKMWVTFYAQFMPSKFPQNISRKEKRVLIIAPGMGLKAHPAVGRMIWSAGFQVSVNYNIQNPEPLSSAEVQGQCNILVSDIQTFKPDAIICGSKGGRYLLDLWQKLQTQKISGWNGAAVMINAYPACKKLPPNYPVVVVHGASDETFFRDRASLDTLISTGSHSKAFLYYTAGGGDPPHPSDNHDNLLTLLDNDCLPRLLDAVIDAPKGSGESINPEYNFISSWRMFLSERRCKAEDFLGHRTDQLVLKLWENKTSPLVNLEEVNVGSTERNAVEDIFLADPISRSFHAANKGWPNPSATSKAKILSVLRVENAAQELSWRSKYEGLEMNLQSEGMNITAGVHTRWLFHGTNEDSLWNIVRNPQNGFAPLAARDVALWGKGIYFARDSEYSDRFGWVVPAKDGTKYIILSLVLTGMSSLGSNQRSLHLQQRDGHRTYDSFVDMLSSPEIFVIGEGSNAYPAYVIKYQTV